MSKNYKVVKMCLLIQKGMNKRWYISSVTPTLYRDGLERLIFRCSHCFLSFFICCQENMLMLKYNHQKTKREVLLHLFLYYYYFESFVWL